MEPDKVRRNFQDGQVMRHWWLETKFFTTECLCSFCIVSLCLGLAKHGKFVRSLWRSLTGRTDLSALTRSHSCTR
jgi:hypothetical protein